MDLNQLSKLTVINKRTGTQNIQSNTQSTSGSRNNIVLLNNDDRIKTIIDTYTTFRKGEINEDEFKSNILRFDKRVFNNIDEAFKNQIRISLFQTLKWFIQLKLLISTSHKVESLIEFSNTISLNKNYKNLNNPNITRLLYSLENPNMFQDNFNPKEASDAIKNLLKIFIEDDILHPIYKIDNELIVYLSNNRPTFLNEITLLFDLYSKVFGQYSKDFLEDKNIRQIGEIQPRFDMINRHILSSNLSTRIDYNLDLDKISEDRNYSKIETSQMGLQKRMNFLNDWLINGIIHTQVSINRLSGLKPNTQVGKVKPINDFSSRSATSKYEIWMILEETKSFMQSLKGLTEGTAFITGIQSNDILDILDVNY